MSRSHAFRRGKIERCSVDMLIAFDVSASRRVSRFVESLCVPCGEQQRNVAATQIGISAQSGAFQIYVRSFATGAARQMGRIGPCPG